MESKVLVILQARMSSTRLPAKVLLPIAGIPIVELAYRRASNTGHSVIVATSLESTDDVLARFLGQKSIPHFRGDLDDVLGRFHEASQGVPEDHLIVRLTSDNILPDGAFIDLAIHELKQKNLRYIRSDSKTLPYGLSVEVFYKKDLDEAFFKSKDPSEREHVTPYIRKVQGDHVLSVEKTFKTCRVTIDYFADYLFMDKFMSGTDNVVTELWNSLLEKNEPRQLSKQVPKFIIGGAQFGNAYGINSIGVVSAAVTSSILEKAGAFGITAIDTARAYGSSECLIGQFLKTYNRGQFSLMTKLDHLIPDKESPANLEKWIRVSVLESLKNLRADTLDVVMFHRPSQVSLESLRILKDMKDEGLLKKIGISINTPDELQVIVSNSEIEHVQLPCNILDHRWRNVAVQKAIHEFSDRGGSIHVRSAFLQGVLFSSDPTKWPAIEKNYSPATVLEKISALEKNKGRSITDLSLHYLLNKDWVDGIVIGVEAADQLEMIVQKFNNNVNVSDCDVSIFNDLPEDLLTPSKWIKK